MTTIDLTTPPAASVAPAEVQRADEIVPAMTTEVKMGHYALAVARISIGFVFLWAFFDKLFGLTYSTPSAKAWIHGGSPTTGYLSNVKGPFGDAFHQLSGSAFADWLFMAGLLGIGLALVLGVGMRIGALSGALLLVLMWAASLPIATNPFMDDHLIYAFVIVGLALVHNGDTLGFGSWWSKLSIVRRWPALR